MYVLVLNACLCVSRTRGPATSEMTYLSQCPYSVNSGGLEGVWCVGYDLRKWLCGGEREKRRLRSGVVEYVVVDER